MADEPKFENVQLVGRRVPDFQTNVDGSGNKVQTPLPGTYEVGFMVGKAFHVLHSFHAGNLFNADGSHVRPADEGESQGGESQA
jgi:hypothetical protein